MTQEQIEGSKLIGEFDGYEYLPQGSINGIKGILVKEGAMSMHLDETKPFHTKYHKDWNQLMPVVQKIIGLGWQFQLNSYGVSNDAKFINSENYIQNVAWSTPLLATYNVVIDFIKFYNKNK